MQGIVGKQLSRQRCWQKKMVAAGRCQTCGGPRNLYKQHCDFHGAQIGQRVRQYMRRYLGIPREKWALLDQRRIARAQALLELSDHTER